MFRSLFGSIRHKPSDIDRQNSKAHLLLLSKFLQPQELENFLKSESWQEVLKESPQNAIEQFLADSLIVQANLSEHLAYKFKVSELKAILKRYDLSVSGRKDDLITRLIQADLQGIEEVVADFSIYCCTEQGRKIAEQFLINEKEHRIQVEQSVRDALRQREFRKASQLVATFETEQVFQRGINIEWQDYNTEHDVSILENIFGAVPRILSEVESESLEELRVAAGMMHLWGASHGNQWISSDLTTGLKFDNNTAISMLQSYATYLGNIADFQRSGVKTVNIRTVEDPYVCEECKRLARKVHKLGEVPELPLEKCTCEFGCRCWVTVAEF